MTGGGKNTFILHITRKMRILLLYCEVADPWGWYFTRSEWVFWETFTNGLCCEHMFVLKMLQSRLLLAFSFWSVSIWHVWHTVNHLRGWRILEAATLGKNARSSTKVFKMLRSNKHLQSKWSGLYCCLNPNIPIYHCVSPQPNALETLQGHLKPNPIYIFPK